MTCLSRLAHLTVLLVEDEKTLATLLRDAIGDYFGSFELAFDGQEGLEAVALRRPDLIITDITMPGMNGLEMSNRIREVYPDLPIIILSAYSDKEYLLEAIDIGITKYLIKPFDPDDLLEAICALIEKIEPGHHVELLSPFVFDTQAQKLMRDGEMVRLSRRENLFFACLIEREDRFLATEEIKAALWEDAEVSDERLRVFINRLRQKTHPDLIRNLVGQGYLLQTRPPQA